MKKLYFGGPILTMDKACPRVEPMQIQHIQVLATIKEDVVIYRKDGFTLCSSSSIPMS